MTRHALISPEGLPPATGFSYGAIAVPGRTLYLAGITGQRQDLGFDESLVDQFAVALSGVGRVIEEAGGAPSDLVSMSIYTTDVEGYVSNLGPIGAVYRDLFGKHFPAMALIGVSRLFDPRAQIELICVAVVPAQDD